MIRYVALFIIFFLIIGCSSKIDISADLTGPIYIEHEANVSTSPLQISVRPYSSPKEEPRVIIVPIRMMNPIEHANDIAKSIGWEIWNTCLSNEVFSHVEYASSQSNRSLQELLQYARSKKATLLVTGMSNFFLDGGSVGKSRVALNLQIYDVATGSLVWSLHQTGELTPSTVKDYIFIKEQKVIPDNAVGTIIATLLHNMVQPVKLWRNSRPHFTAESL